MTVIAEGFPNLTWDEACQKFHEPSQKSFKVELQAAIDAYESKQKGNPVVFSPPTDVTSCQTHICSTYFEVAFFTEADVVRLTSCTPQSLGMKTKATITIEDGSTLQGFLISMRGLPADEIAAARKVKIETQISSCLSEHVLQKENQIRAQQGLEIYQILNTQLSNLPNWVKPSARKNLQSHASLMEKANDLIQAMVVESFIAHVCSNDQ